MSISGQLVVGSRDAGVWGFWGLGFRVLGFRVLGFGFRGFGV